MKGEAQSAQGDVPHLGCRTVTDEGKKQFCCPLVECQYSN